MALDLLKPQLLYAAEKNAGKTLFIVAIVLGLSYFSFIKLAYIVFGISVEQILWGYLILNVGAVNVLEYLKERKNPTCPKCNAKLKLRKEYDCKKCGVLNYSKR